MKKSEKNALTDVIAMLNAIVNGSDEDDKNNHQPAHSEENPSEEEIAFVREIANDKPFSIIGIGVRQGEGPMANIRIGKTCLRHMVIAYLEKYCHE